MRFVLSAFALAGLASPAIAQGELMSEKVAARLLVPAYVFPGTAPGSAELKYWNALVAAARKVREYAAKNLPGEPVFLNVGRANGGATILTPDLPNEVALLWEAPEKDDLKGKFALPAWAEKKANGAYVFPRHRFAVLVHSKGKLEREFVPLINDPPPKGKRVGWLYVTDREVARDRHPWDKLPPYWDELVTAVKAQNSAKK